jgi:pimeloyl-ACP methyl ester carboxylesterase
MEKINTTVKKQTSDLERGENESFTGDVGARRHDDEITNDEHSSNDGLGLETKEEIDLVTANNVKHHYRCVPRQRWLTRRLDTIWSNRFIGLAIITLIAALWGILAGFWMPRGALTNGQAMASIFLSFIPFVVCGFVAKTFWTLLVAPLTFLVCLELMKLRVDGPTVDKPSFTTYGTIALMMGRGVQYLLTVVPMMIGIVFGAAGARTVAKRRTTASEEEPRQESGRPWLQYSGYVLMGIFAIGLLIMIVVFAIRPQTEAIEDEDAVAELIRIPVNGHNLALMIRGQSIYNPVLLFLAGGPGGSELGAMRNHLEELETYFTVITWDQRGCGRSYVELDPIDTISPQGYVSDTVQVTDYLRNRFDQDQIYLLGQSWGSLLGVIVVQQYPERYKAYVGTGQMVSVRETDIRMYNDTVAWLRANGHENVVNELLANGPPPYGTSVYKYETYSLYKNLVYPYDHSMNSEGEGEWGENLGGKEYSLTERLHLFPSFLDTYAALYPQIQGYDFRENNGSTFELPVFFAQGAHEVSPRSDIFDEWYPSIMAPTKDLIVLETSGHRPLFEQPHEFVQYMSNTVLHSTQQ